MCANFFTSRIFPRPRDMPERTQPNNDMSLGANHSLQAFFPFPVRQRPEMWISNNSGLAAAGDAGAAHSAVIFKVRSPLLHG